MAFWPLLEPQNCFSRIIKDSLCYVLVLKVFPHRPLDVPLPLITSPDQVQSSFYLTCNLCRLSYSAHLIQSRQFL
jgi:hypothetical protein